jgi:hypothetical protein
MNCTSAHIRSVKKDHSYIAELRPGSAQGTKPIERKTTKLNQNRKQLKANCKGQKPEETPNEETQSAANEKREIALEWANQRQAKVPG